MVPPAFIITVAHTSPSPLVGEVAKHAEGDRGGGLTAIISIFALTGDSRPSYSRLCFEPDLLLRGKPGRSGFQHWTGHLAPWVE